MSLLQVEGLSKTFGGVHAVEGLSYSVEPGKIHAIIGPNGAGKTTLFNLITGIYQPGSGHIYLKGQSITGLSPHALAQRGMSRTFQNLQIFFNMSAIENVMVGMHMHLDTRFLPALFRLPAAIRGERACRAAALELMEHTGIARYADTSADGLPYGILKRLEIARALAAKPSLLLLDEPAAGLNPSETAEIDSLIQQIAETGTTVVLVEHDMKLVMGISAHILVLDYGKKLAEGTPDEIRANPGVVAAYLGGEEKGPDEP